MKVGGDDHLEGLNRCGAFKGKSVPISRHFLNNLQIWFLYTGLVYKLGCEAAMKVRDVDHLEGAHLLCHFWREICLVSRFFLGTLTEVGSIHWVGVETCLRSSHEGKGVDHLEGAHSMCHFWREICLVLRYFMGTLTEVGSIH